MRVEFNETNKKQVKHHSIMIGERCIYSLFVNQKQEKT